MVSRKTQRRILIAHCNEQSQGQPEVTAERNSKPPGSIIPSRLYIEPSLVIYYWNTILFSMLNKFWVNVFGCYCDPERPNDYNIYGGKKSQAKDSPDVDRDISLSPINVHWYHSQRTNG